MAPTDRLTLPAALAELRQRRTHEIVVTAMGAAREWMALGPSHPLDFVFVPSSMGQATSLGLGLALARPERKVIVCNGDGSTLMNLGSLVTITAAAPSNLVLIVFDNGAYEVTGAQPTLSAADLRRDRQPLDYAAIAGACGFSAIFTCDALAAWSNELPAILAAEGPTFVALPVPPVPGGVGPRSPGPAPARAAAFMEALREDAAKRRIPPSTCRPCPATLQPSRLTDFDGLPRPTFAAPRFDHAG
ncbi:MAG: hypothetical protein KY476_19130 [Planctomycetes bacterium]|nr:hypothetical protein [Planctomycetota bacterium]